MAHHLPEAPIRGGTRAPQRSSGTPLGVPVRPTIAVFRGGI